MNPTECLRLLYLAAHQYYVEDGMEGETARALGVSRPTVSRLIAEARREHLVHIAVVNPLADLAAMAQAHRKRLGLAGAMCYPAAAT